MWALCVCLSVCVDAFVHACVRVCVRWFIRSCVAMYTVYTDLFPFMHRDWHAREHTCMHTVAGQDLVEHFSQSTGWSKHGEVVHELKGIDRRL